MVVFAGAEGAATVDERKLREKNKKKGKEEGSCQLLQDFEWFVVGNQGSGGV